MRPADLFHLFRVARGKEVVSALGEENEVGAQDEDTI